MRAQRKLTKRKCAPADGRFAADLVIRCFVAPIRRAVLARTPLKLSSMTISASHASFLGILKGVEEQDGVYEQVGFQRWGRGVPYQDRERQGVATEPPGMGPWRVLGRNTRPSASKGRVEPQRVKNLFCCRATPAPGR